MVCVVDGSLGLCPNTCAKQGFCTWANKNQLPEGPALNVRRECEDPSCFWVDQRACKEAYVKRFLSAKDHECVAVPPCMTFHEAAVAVEEHKGSLIERVKDALPKAAPTLPSDRATRKSTPIYSGFIKYFPLAISAVAQLSFSANEVHNPGEPLHWSKDKSNDHRDCMGRHLTEIDEYDVEPDHDYHYLHAVKNAWRAMAELQMILETGKAPRVKKGELP